MKKISLLIVTLVLCGCGGGNNSSSSSTNIKFDISPIDNTTPPEQGGYGFEEVSESLGYQTYVWSEDKDGNYFGDPGAIKGGQINYIHSLFPRTMRYYGQNGSQVLNGRTIHELCYEALLETHPVTLEFVPRLATHWYISDDKMTFKFRINPDARWWDGMPVTSDDVIATWDLLMDETILAPSYQITYSKFERPIVESKYIVSVKANSKNWRNFLYFASSMRLLPHHILKDLDGTAFLEEYAFRVVPGTGPYIIRDEKIINQESYIIERRDDYWAKDNPFVRYRYNFDRIKISAIKDNDALRFEKFKKGDQDIFQVYASRRWVEETDFEATEKGWIKKQRVFSEKPAGTTGYFFNMRKWPFNDKNIRYAFCYLYNREKMNQEMYYNEYGMMNSLYSGSVYENPNNNPFKYNPEKAMELLAQSGYKTRNSDGWLVNDETGRVLSFEIPIQKNREYMVTPVQQMLKEYGIDMQIRFIDYNTMIKNVNARNFNLASLGYTGLIYPNPEGTLRSSLADRKDNNNVWGFKSDRVDEFLDEYDICFDQSRRIEIVREIDGIFHETHPIAYGIVRNYARIMWWDKFKYPDWMLTRYGGEHWDIFNYWWYDEEKNNLLNDAIEQDKQLPLKPIDMKYWPNYLSNN